MWVNKPRRGKWFGRGRSTVRGRRFGRSRSPVRENGRWAVWRDRSGVTIAELMAALALNSMLILLGCGILMQSLHLYGRISAVSDAVWVSRMILDKVAGEIRMAEDGSGIRITGAQSGAEDDDFPSIEVETRNRERITISRTEDGGDYLMICCEPAVGVPDERVRTSEPGLDRGYVIADLHFARRSREDKAFDVIEVGLTLRNRRTGYEYSGFRCISCPHLEPEKEKTKNAAPR